MAAVVVVDVEAGLRLTDFAPFAGDNDVARAIRGPGQVTPLVPAAGAAIAGVPACRVFVFDTVTQAATVGVRAFHVLHTLLALAPADQLPATYISVAVVDQRRRSAVLELDVGREITGAGPP